MTPAAMLEWGFAGAFGLGIVAALHPCPLSTLAGAVLLVAAPDRSSGGGGLRRATDGSAWRAGAIVFGMVVALMLVGMLIGGGLTQLRFFSIGLPGVLRPLLAPLLIVAGLLQTGVFASSRKMLSGAGGERLAKGGPRTGPRMFALGMVLALSFCPATAGLFFGVLIPLATAHRHPVLYALAYGLGYGLPLLAVAACLGTGIRPTALRRYAYALSSVSGWGLIALGTWLTWRLL